MGVSNAAVFGFVPMVLLRRSTVAAAPAVAIALACRSGAAGEDECDGYPLVSYAVSRILHGRR
ncbi:MAG: hypothetical protein EG823_07250 [Actinobacteria bacterium]|nr:hypothetical protein [Actinomycetota bacterium]